MHDASRLHQHHDDPVVEVDDRKRTIALAVLCLCAFTTAVDITITNIALPFIGRDLDADTSDLQWIIDIYNIVLAGLLVLGGGLADRLGRRKVFLAGYALFGLACLLAAFSPSSEALIGARALMGIGAAGVVAPALAIIAGLFPPEKRGGAIAAWAVFGAAGLAVGPVLGGLLLDHYWWGSVFLVNVPVVVVGVVLGVRTIPESHKPGDRTLDVMGAVLSVVGLGTLLFGVIEGPERGWGSPEVIGSIAVGVIVVVAFFSRELRVRSPLFDVRILARTVVAAGSITLFMSYVVFCGMLFLLPQYLQDVQNESIVSVGLLLVPFAAVFGIASTRSACVMASLGGRRTLTIGLLISAVGVAMLALTVRDALWLTILATTVVAVGLSGLIAPASTVVMNDLPEAKAGDGSSLSMVSRFTGAAVGVAVVGSVFASVYSSHLADAVTDLPPAKAAAAQGSIQGALGVADGLGMSAAANLTRAAQDAFDAGARAGYVVIAVLGLLATAWAWHALRPRP